MSMAINSMFRWYQHAAKCYVYLSDVQVPDEVTDAMAFRITWEAAFQRSKWFTRGWTLQELLAPATVEFFSRNRKQLGTKISLEQDIYNITKIPISAIRGRHLSEFSIEERMKWAVDRKTTLKEDRIYCLLGIFGVFLPLIYGEGYENASSRLRDEVQRRLGNKKWRDRAGAQDLDASSLLPFPRNELFVGREDQLRSLESFLDPSNTHRRIAIYGLGGCGKSALALEIAYRAIERLPRYLVLWIPAISRETFERAYRDIGIFLEIPGITDDNADVRQLVKKELSSTSRGDWLMIVDNADDVGVLLDSTSGDRWSSRLVDYLPRRNRGIVLFTTRSRKAAEDLTQSNVLKLEDMNIVEAERLLARRMRKESLLNDKESVNELLNSLSYLPLAIVQASAFINKNDISVADYVSLFQQSDTEAELFSRHFEDPSRYQESESTIAKTWYISFDQILREDKLAAEYLSFMACIDRVNIPLSLLPVGDSQLQRTDAIGTLKGYAFLTERQHTAQQSHTERFFDIHRLVHTALIWWLQEHNKWADQVSTAGARLEELIPRGGHEGKQAWTAYLSHAGYVATSTSSTLDDTRRASLLERVGLCQYTLGEYSAAEVTQRQVYSLREMALGKKHPDTLTSMNNLASVLSGQGKFKEAEALHRQELATRETVLGKDHPDTLTSMNNLASVLSGLGKYEEAEAMHRQELAICKNMLGNEHPYTLASINNLASVLSGLGKYEEAEVMHRQTLATCEKVLGKEHPNTLMSVNNLALVLYRQGKYKESEAMHRQTLATRETVLGKDHPNTLTSKNNLASVLYRQGKYEEAEAMYRQTLATREKELGKEHPDTLLSMNNLALVLSRQGKYEAEAMHRQELAICKNVLGKEHPDTLASINNLALVLSGQGKYEEAEALHRQTLATRETVLRKEHPNTLISMDNLALVLSRQGKYEEAEAMHRQTLVTYEKVLGKDHPNTLTSINNLASVLDSQGKYEEAEAMHRQTLATREKVLGKEHPDTLASVHSLAFVLAKMNCYEEAAALYQRALTGYVTVLGQNHPTTRACCQQYSNLLVLQEKNQADASAGRLHIPVVDNKPSPQANAESRMSRGLAKIGIRLSRTSI